MQRRFYGPGLGVAVEANITFAHVAWNSVSWLHLNAGEAGTRTLAACLGGKWKWFGERSHSLCHKRLHDSSKRVEESPKVVFTVHFREEIYVSKQQASFLDTLNLRKMILYE